MLLLGWNKITIPDVYSPFELIFSVKKSAEKLKVKPQLVFFGENHKIRYVTKLGNLPYLLFNYYSFTIPPDLFCESD